MNQTLLKTKHSFGLALRIILTVGIIALIIWKFNFLRNIDVRAIIEASVSMPKMIATLLGIYILKGATFIIPASVIYIAIGMSLPIWLALIINTVGIMLEISVSYLIGVILGGEFVKDKLKKNKKGTKILNLYEKYEIWGVFIIRIVSLPIDLCSLFFGSVRTKFGKYFFMSLLGIMPRVILFTILGDKVYDIIPMKYLIPVLAVLVAVGMVVWTVSYAVKSAKSETLAGKSPYTPLSESARDIILDTDMGPDCDDAGALAIMMQYINKYHNRLLGIVNCTSNPYANSTIKAICEYYGCDEILVAKHTGNALLEDNSKYSKKITKKYCKYENSAVSAVPAEDFYKEVLSKAKDDSITIISIGMLTEISKALDNDTLLFNKKVNSIVSMAGEFPSGKEFNVSTDTFAFKNVIEKFRNIIVFSGYETGKDIKTGFENESENNPVFDCYKLHCDGDLPYLNSSYDLTAVQYAFEGNGTFYALSKPVDITVDSKGKISTSKNKHSNRYYLIKQEENEIIAKELNELLRKEP